MASIKLTALLLLAAASAQAQSFSFSDLFGQANKQKQYYLQQIAAYNAFESELKMGYNVMKHGLNGIAEINTAELNAHNTYYTSLKQPGTVVKNNTQVQDILTWQTDIENSFSQPFRGLTENEQNYIGVVKMNLLNACSADLTELQNLLQYETLQMTDDERLKQLGKIHTAMQDKYQFSQSFCNSVHLLGAQRQQGINDTQTLKSLYETN
ncbi:MAG TPA: hypothetical protein VNW95_09505 [Mucilaginibacter sp.]|jgi:hypothetical protein|nr:hypothetical protein [Mucilaginibacter sp.]